MRSLSLFGLFTLATACVPSVAAPRSTPDADAAPPAPVPAPIGDAAVSPSDPTGCIAGCAQLANLGCPEGNDVQCVRVCTNAQTAHWGLDLKPTCWSSATTAAAVRACGTVACSPTTLTIRDAGSNG